MPVVDRHRRALVDQLCSRIVAVGFPMVLRGASGAAQQVSQAELFVAGGGGVSCLAMEFGMMKLGRDGNRHG